MQIYTRGSVELEMSKFRARAFLEDRWRVKSLNHRIVKSQNLM